MSNKYYSLQGKLKENGEIYNYKIHRRNLYGFSSKSMMPYIPNGCRYSTPTFGEIMQLLRIYKQYNDWHTSPSAANFSSCLQERTDYFAILRQIYPQSLFDDIGNIMCKGISEFQEELGLNSHSWLKEYEEGLSSEEKCKAVYANMHEIARRILTAMRSGSGITVIAEHPTTKVYNSNKERHDDYLLHGSTFYKNREALAVPAVHPRNGKYAGVCLALAQAYRAYGAYVFLMGDATYRKTPLYPEETKIAFNEYKRALATDGDMLSILIAYADAISYAHHTRKKTKCNETNYFA